MTDIEASSNKQTLMERASRFKLLRGMLGLNKGEIAEALGYSRASISYWENGVLGGLTLQGGQRLVEFAQEKGISCDLNWLMKGTGSPPGFKTTLPVSEPTSKPVELEQTLHVNQSETVEIEIFKKLNPNTIVLAISDEAMKPYLNVGEIVGGVWETPKFPIRESYTGIIEINDQLQIRRIRQGSQPGTIDAHFTSNDARQNQPHEINNLIVTKIARIIRVWTPYPAKPEAER